MSSNQHFFRSSFCLFALTTSLIICPTSFAGGEGHHDDEHVEVIQVTSTRLARAAADEPVRVEVIVQEELVEKAIMRPGNISMLVAETGGVRVQTTSPALGSANIRLQGLFGRYTQLLNDGLPLYGGQAASIGLLQIPPTDLSSVEIIKGAASSLYGGSALGGVINLISRRASVEPEAEVLLNYTSRDGQDLTAYSATGLTKHSQVSFTAGAHHQATQDFDQDGWIDMAGYERYTARPRLFWENDAGTSVYATAGFMTENRHGGTLPGATTPDGSYFPQNQDSQRMDAGVIIKSPISEQTTWSLRSSIMEQEHNKIFGLRNNGTFNIEEDQHESMLLESSLAGYTGADDQIQWVLGAAYQAERFDSFTYPEFTYDFTVPGIFSQAEVEWNDVFSTSLSARFDDHNVYGQQTSPRISLLYRPHDWTVRASFGRGYFAPTPFVEEIDASGLGRLAPLDDLRAEEATTASLNIGYQHEKLESHVTLFSSVVEHATQLLSIDAETASPYRITLQNALGDSTISGAEFGLRYKIEDIKLSASYLYVDSEEERINTVARPIALTPEHSFGFVAMWEEHGSHRVGFEAYYTGTQALDNNPYIENSDPYWHLGLLGEITLGRYSWFINAENLLDVRQTKEHPLTLPQRALSGRWTTDIWSRNDGFIVNAGVRIKL